MNRVITLLFLGLAMTTLTTSAKDKATQSKVLPEVILLGDSIRMSYQTSVKKRLEGTAIVWGPKDNCSHAAHTLKNLDRWLKGHKPTIIHINCGLHDMWLFDAEKRRYSIEDYTANMRKILRQLQEKTDATIILALTTPVNETYQASSKYGRVVRYEKDIPKYNQAVSQVARELGILIDDLYTPLFQADIKITLGKDGVHLSPKGVGIAANTIANCIRDALETK